MGLNTKASAALVFLILYAILFSLLLLGFLTRHLRLRSRYGLILFYVMVRLASQATGLALGVVGYANTSLPVACFILGGEPPTFLSRILTDPNIVSVNSRRVLCTHSVHILLPHLVAKSQFCLRFMAQATFYFWYNLVQTTLFIFHHCQLH